MNRPVAMERIFKDPFCAMIRLLIDSRVEQKGKTPTAEEMQTICQELHNTINKKSYGMSIVALSYVLCLLLNAEVNDDKMVNLLASIEEKVL